MKKLALALIIGISLVSCVETNPNGSPTEKVGLSFLFEKDGVKVYRFFDEGRYHYFTTNGETITSQKSGKSNYEENINDY